jgi:hypothetical protein
VSRLPKVAWLVSLLLSLLGCRGVESRKSTPIHLAPELASMSPLPRGTAHYGISARLDEQRHEVHGHAHISWTNRSDKAVDVIYLHLYLNAFRQGSLFLRGAGGRSGGLAGRQGRIEIHRLQSATFADRDLWPGAEKHSPGDPADQTDIKVPLPARILPGEQLDLDVEFLAVLPEIVERTGYHGDYHLLGQWFPKLARLERDGSWAHFAFHPFAEFYADFDDYEVILDVPKDHVVGASGRLTRLAEAKPGRARYLARAESVVDFAWTSWPGFLRQERTIGRTKAILLMPKGQPGVQAAHWDTLTAGLGTFDRWLGDYPYPELTVVVPPHQAERSGGMEYPSFITTGGGEMAGRLGVRAVELLVIHELAHQWFQSLIATNEAQYPFLDEGLASYAEWRFLESQYGSGSLADVFGLHLSRTAGGRFGAFYGRRAPTQVNQPAREFSSFHSLAREIYCRTPLILETLARIYGHEAIDTAIADYARTARGGHPLPADFYQALAARLGQAQLATIVELFEEPRRFNLGIQALSTGPGPNGSLASTLVVKREGGPGLPYDAAVQLVGGHTLRLQSDGRRTPETFSFRHDGPIELVQLDPDERLLLDEDPADDRFDPITRGLPDEPPSALTSALTLGLELMSFGLGP